MNTQTPTVTTEPQDRVHDPLPEAALPFPVVPRPSPSGSSRDDEWEEELWPSTPPDPPLVEAEGIRQVNIGWLKPHPFSLKVYGTETADKDLVESIRLVGIQTPLQVTVDGVVISGHRRLEAAKQTHLKTVPVSVARSRSLPGAVEEQILETNRARVKTIEQQLREYVAFKCIETARAKERNGYRWDLVPNSAPGEPEAKPGVDPRPLTTLVREVGKARDIAAKKVGMVGSTAADGEKVVAALDRLWAEEKYEDHGRLHHMLFKSIHAALKLGLERGWIAKPAYRPKRVSQVAAVADDAQPHDKPAHDPQATGEAADEHGLNDTTPDPVGITGATGIPVPEEEPTPPSQTGPDLDLDQQPPTGDAAAELPRAVPPASNENAPALPPPVVPPSDPSGPAVTPMPTADLDDGRQAPVEAMIPADKVSQAAAKISWNDFAGCNDPDILACSRHFVGRVAAILNEQAREFPGMAGRELYRALGIANNKILMAMKWV